MTEQTTTNSTPADGLCADIQALLDKIRADNDAMNREHDLDLSDPIADVVLKLGGQDYVYTTDGGNQIHTGESKSDVSLSFDGAGYDYFSYAAEGAHWEGGYCPPISDKYREMLNEIASKHGYYFEDVTNWCIGFYPN